jgi:hypothetical protein
MSERGKQGSPTGGTQFGVAGARAEEVVSVQRFINWRFAGCMIPLLHAHPGEKSEAHTLRDASTTGETQEERNANKTRSVYDSLAEWLSGRR